jgi:Leucine-rich repeat (LRR) protein
LGPSCSVVDNRDGTATLSCPDGTSATLVGAPCTIDDTAVDTVLVASECDSLVDFFASTSGQDWTTATGWNTATDPCSWYGVTCNNGRLTGLSLSDNNLSGSIPRSFEAFTDLATVSLSGNSCLTASVRVTELLDDLDENWNDGCAPGCVIGSTSVPTELTQIECDGLVALFNSTNGPNWTTKTKWLTATDPCTWYGVDCNPGLVYLSLYANGLSGSIPTEIGDLTNLTVLGLRQNSGLSGPIPEEIGSLTSLTSLTLDGNGLTGQIPRSLGNLTSLVTLFLDGNDLVGPVPEELGALTEVTRLWLNDNGLSGAIPTDVINLPNLATFPLRGNGCFTANAADVALLNSFDPDWADGCE